MDLTWKGRSGGPWGLIWTGQNRLPRLPCCLRRLLREKEHQHFIPGPAKGFVLGLNHTLTLWPLHQLPLSLEQPSLCSCPDLPESSLLHFPESSEVASWKRPSLSPDRVAKLVRVPSGCVTVVSSSPNSGLIQESTNECINEWNNKWMFLSLPLPSCLSLKINTLKKS